MKFTPEKRTADKCRARAWGWHWRVTDLQYFRTADLGDLYCFDQSCEAEALDIYIRDNGADKVHR